MHVYVYHYVRYFLLENVYSAADFSLRMIDRTILILVIIILLIGRTVSTHNTWNFPMKSFYIIFCMNVAHSRNISVDINICKLMYNTFIKIEKSFSVERV